MPFPTLLPPRLASRLVARLVARLVLPCVLGCASLAAAQQDFRVLPADFNATKSDQMMRSYLRKLADQAFDRRLAELDSALDNDELEAYQQRRREFLRWTLGEMPERTELNAQVTGVIREAELVIEKVMFESQPGFHVTANVYRPKGEGPFPAVLHPVGHSQNGKAYTEYQKANRLLAKHGFIVLCYDPIGQGERKQFLDEKGNGVHGASGEHQQLGVAPILLGRGLASYMVWDGVRALDYLCSRSDVDPKRLGCMGISGGGNMTSYLMAYDDRIAAAAPGCFVTTHRQKNERPGPGDAEQNLFAQIRDGFDHPDFLLARAPKPTLILAATKDFVPIEGTWDAYRQAKRVYTALGYPERVALAETNKKHGFSKALREAAARFMCRWLQDRHVEVFEDGNVTTLKDQALQVTPRGQLLQLPGERSLPDLFSAYEAKLAKERPPLTSRRVREVTGIRPLVELPRPKVEVVEKSQGLTKLIFRTESGILLPALYWSVGDKQPLLMAPSGGKDEALKEAMRRHGQGHPVLLIEVRDTGETRTSNWRFFGAEYCISLMLGRCWSAMWAEDILVAGRWLESQHDSGSIQIWSSGDVGVAARHAAALEASLISSLTTHQSLESWRNLMTSQAAHARVHTAVQGALKYYDLPDLEGLK